MDSSFWFDAIHLGWSIVYMEVLHAIISFSEDVFYLSKQYKNNELAHVISNNVVF